MTQVSLYWNDDGAGDASLSTYDQDEVALKERLAWGLYDARTQSVLDCDDTITFNAVTYDLSNKLAVSNPSGVTLRVATGGAINAGWLYLNSANVDFTTTDDGTAIAAPGSGSNYYRVVLRINWTAGTVRAAVLDADVSAPASVTQTWDTEWEVSLATVQITSASVVTVTDTRVMAGARVNPSNLATAQSNDWDLTVTDAATATTTNIATLTHATSGTAVANFGGALAFALENASGSQVTAARLAAQWDVATGAAESARIEIRIITGGAENLSGVINPPATASADGNARGAGAVDLQQYRSAVTQVASGTGAIIAGGRENTASGDYSYAAGYQNTASGDNSHADGNSAEASGANSHAEGIDTVASGNAAHAEGNGGIASAASAHVEGLNTTASEVYAHAEGNTTIASGNSGHAEGNAATASGAASHAEGLQTLASALAAHAEGYTTQATANHSHAEGDSTVASAAAAHAEGDETDATGATSHAEGYYSNAAGVYSHAGGYNSKASAHAQFSRSGGLFAARGDAQYSDLHLRRAVTHSDANWYQLYLDGAAVQLTIPADTVYVFDALISGATQGCTKTFAFRVVGCIENDGGTTAIKGTPTVTTIYDGDDTDFDARASADDTNEALLLEDSDSTSGGDPVRWSAVVRLSEVTYPA